MTKSLTLILTGMLMSYFAMPAFAEDAKKPSDKPSAFDTTLKPVDKDKDKKNGAVTDPTKPAKPAVPLPPSKPETKEEKK